MVIVKTLQSKSRGWFSKHDYHERINNIGMVWGTVRDLGRGNSPISILIYRNWSIGEAGKKQFISLNTNWTTITSAWQIRSSKHIYTFISIMERNNFCMERSEFDYGAR